MPVARAARKRRPRKGKLQRWQVVLAAIIAAVASIVVALISSIGSSSNANTSGLAPENAGISMLGVSAAITSFSSMPAPHTTEIYSFFGTVQGWSFVKQDNAEIFVVSRPANAAVSSPQQWLVSPPAQVFDGRKWVLHWRVSDPPPDSRWFAIITIGDQLIDTPGLSPEIERLILGLLG
jgi:hypothetical protein